MVFRQTQLYTFLRYCEEEPLDKKILDCGAGGSRPPLAIFKEHGYETYGIEISKDAIENAKVFQRDNNMELNIIEGDMRSLPFDDNTISYAYSYNSIFHMRKEEIGQAITEMKRVVKKNGLIFLNFVTVDDGEAFVGEKVGEGEYIQREHGGKVLHSYFERDEAEKYFDGFKVLYKEVRIRDMHISDGSWTAGFVDYILQKQ